MEEKKLNGEERRKWAGVPWHERYSMLTRGPQKLIKKMREIDPYLDLKFYMPTMTWHVVRYPHGFSREFVKCFDCVDNPEHGLRGPPGMWIIDALKAGDLRRRDIEKELLASEAARDKAVDSALADASLEAAKDMRKPLQALYDYGEESTFHEVY